MVVEVGDGVAGAYCGKLFADYGARVIKVEPPVGSPLRHMGPFPEGETGARDGGALHLFVDTSKESVTLDLDSADGLALVRALLRRAHVLLESLPPARSEALGLRQRALEPLNPALVVVSVTPFGLEGPYRDYEGSGFLVQALSGHMHLSGDPTREPLALRGHQMEYQAGVHAFYAALAALMVVPTVGGQQVDVSLLETLASIDEFSRVRYTHGGIIQRRVGNHYDVVYPVVIYPCRDGWVGLCVPNDAGFRRLCEAVGRPELANDPRFAEHLRVEHARELEAELLPWFLAQDAREISRILQEEHHLVCAPAQNIPEVLAEEHYRVRGFWAEQEHPQAGRVTLPGPFARLGDGAWRARPAPAPGEHNAAVLAGELGLPSEELRRLRELEVI